MNIYDIARKANTSIATVSRVINGKNGVSEKTRQRILDIMDECGYIPNSFAQGLNVDSIKMVGVLCYDIMDMYCSQCVSILERLLQKNGYNALLCCTGNEEDNKNRYFDLLISKRVDAIFLVGSKLGYEANIEHLSAAAQDIPIFLINSNRTLEDGYCILTDEKSAMEEAVAYLAGHGRSRIAYFHDDAVYSGKRKLAGYKSGLEKNGFAADESLIIENTYCEDHDINDGISMTEQLIDNKIAFDAVLCCGDPYAAGAIKALQANGVNVPQEVEIIGFDNSPICQYTSPSLSSINSHIDTIAELAVNYFINIVNGKNVPRETVITTDLVLRESTGEKEHTDLHKKQI